MWDKIIQEYVLRIALSIGALWIIGFLLGAIIIFFVWELS